MGNDSAHSLGTVRVKRDTGKALLVDYEDLGFEGWVPHSVIHDDSEVFDADQNSEGDLIVKQWWAEANDLL